MMLKHSRHAPTLQEEFAKKDTAMSIQWPSWQ